MFLVNLIFAQWILIGRLSCHILINCLELLSGSTNLVLWMHRKRGKSQSSVWATAFFFSFGSRNCFAWLLILIKLQFVMSGLWCIHLSQSYSVVCNLKILKYTIFMKCLHFINSHLRCVFINISGSSNVLCSWGSFLNEK